jgi:hypothetical protein
VEVSYDVVNFFSETNCLQACLGRNILSELEDHSVLSSRIRRIPTSVPKYAVTL